MFINYSKYGYNLVASWDELAAKPNLVALARQDGTILGDRDKIKYLFQYIFESFSFLVQAEDWNQQISVTDFAGLICNHPDKSDPITDFAIAFLRAMDDFGIQGQ